MNVSKISISLRAALITTTLITSVGQAVAFDGNKALVEYYRLQDLCRGALEYVLNNPNCIKRDKAGAVLLANGFVKLDRDNFLPKRYIDAFHKALQYADTESRKVEPTQVWPIMSTMIGMTRSTGISDADIIAIWNDPDMRDEFQARYPYGWALMSEAVRRIALDNAFRKDFRYELLF